MRDEFNMDDAESIEMLMAMEPPENFWDDAPMEEDGFVTMSSDSYDFNAVSEEITDNSKYWSAVREDHLGSYGNAEMRIAAAGFFNIGDVGNDIWMKERDIPFGDYGNSMIGFSSNVMMLFDFESHPELQRRPDPDIIQNFREEDPSVRWAMDEYNETTDPERKEQLANFIAEAESYHERLVEDRFVSVPDWAIDSLSHAMTNSMQYDPQLVPESGEPSALKTRPVSIVKLPTQLEVRKFFNVNQEYTIDASGTREWAVAIQDGQKTMGPFGHSMGTMRMLRSANPDGGREVKEHRFKVFGEMMRDHGFQLFIDHKSEENKYSFNYVGETEDLKTMEATYGKMAKEISQVASFNSALLTHREGVLKGLRRDAFAEVVKQTNMPDTNISIASFLLQATEKNHVGAIEWSDVEAHLDADLVSRIAGRIHGKVDDPTFILEIRQKWGWHTVAVTKSEELANEWRVSEARDIPYFLGTSRERMELGRPSAARPENYDELPETLQAIADHEVEELTSQWIQNCSTGEETLQRYIGQFNAGHRVKKIPAREARHTSWLMNEMPLTQAQLKTAREALAQLGQRVVKQRIANGSYAQKLAFRKLQKALESRLDRWTPDDKDLTVEGLKRIASGPVDIMFTYEERDLPDSKSLNSYIRHGFVFQEEVPRNKMVIPSIKFNHVFHDHSEVFSICKNFRPRTDLQTKAANLLKAFNA